MSGNHSSNSGGRMNLSFYSLFNLNHIDIPPKATLAELHPAIGKGRFWLEFDSW
jgi:hypothetical protein